MPHGVGTTDRLVKALAAALVLAPAACGDPLAPEPYPLHGPFSAERVGAEKIPSEIRPLASGYALTVRAGNLRCPDPATGVVASEVYSLRFGFRDGETEDRTVRFDVICTAEPPDRLVFTYPITGETVVATFWAHEGKVRLSKPMPSEETFHATAGIKYPYVDVGPGPPTAIFVPYG